MLWEKRCQAEWRGSTNQGLLTSVGLSGFWWVSLGAYFPLCEQGTLRLLMGLKRPGDRSSSIWTRPWTRGDFPQVWLVPRALRAVDLSIIRLLKGPSFCGSDP